MSGIKCDNPNCNFVDYRVPVEDYINWLNKPCPNCGSNLLTQEDYDNVQTILKVYEQVKDVEFDEKDLVRVVLSSDGSGDVKMEVEEV